MSEDFERRVAVKVEALFNANKREVLEAIVKPSVEVVEACTSWASKALKVTLSEHVLCVGDFVVLSLDDWQRIPKVGLKTAIALDEALRRDFGFRLGQNIPAWPGLDINNYWRFHNRERVATAETDFHRAVVFSLKDRLNKNESFQVAPV